MLTKAKEAVLLAVFYEHGPVSAHEWEMDEPWRVGLPNGGFVDDRTGESDEFTLTTRVLEDEGYIERVGDELRFCLTPWVEQMIKESMQWAKPVQKGH